MQKIDEQQQQNTTNNKEYRRMSFGLDGLWGILWATEGER